MNMTTERTTNITSLYQSLLHHPEDLKTDTKTPEEVTKLKAEDSNKAIWYEWRKLSQSRDFIQSVTEERDKLLLEAMKLSLCARKGDYDADIVAIVTRAATLTQTINATIEGKYDPTIQY